MNKEIYNTLSEINSLKLAIEKGQAILDKENHRIQVIEDRRSKRKLELENNQESLKEVKTKFRETENLIADFQGKIDQSKSSINSLFDANEIKSFEKQMAHFEAELSKLEDQGFEFMEIIESLESSISDAHSFLEGTLDTIKEIEQEIKDENKELVQKMSSDDERAKLLTERLPSDIRERFSNLLAKNLRFGPLTRINGNCCEICKMVLPAFEVKEIEEHFKLKSCQGCGRLFIPLSAMY